MKTARPGKTGLVKRQKSGCRSISRRNRVRASEGAMKRFIFSLIFLAALFVQSRAQGDVEFVYNKTTGVYEQQTNIWNQQKQAGEIAEKDRQYGDLVISARERDQKAWADFMDYNSRERNSFYRDLSAQLYQEAVAKINRGAARIRAGKASTAFQPDTSFSLVKSLLANAETLAQKQKINKFAALNLKQFREELKKRGLAANDSADGAALVFIVCYELFFGERTSPAHLEFYRRVTRQYLLKSLYFQGELDSERQRKHEIYGSLAMYAKMVRDNRAAVSRGDFEEAKTITQALLEKVWRNSTDTILMTPTGFAHKGEKIIAEGKASNSFNYNPNLQTARLVANGRNTLFKDNVNFHAGIYQERLNYFYQEMQKRGGRRGDLAWCATGVAYANYLILAEKDLTQKQFAGALDFFRNAVLKSPDAQAASDQNKQFACEKAAIEAVSNYQSYLDEKRRGGRYSKLFAQEQLKTLFYALGVDVAKYALTENGIALVRK
jgi:hypothetical protein